MFMIGSVDGWRHLRAAPECARLPSLASISMLHTLVQGPLDDQAKYWHFHGRHAWSARI